MRGHGGTASKHAADASVDERHAFGEAFEELGSGEKAADVAVADDGRRLVDHVLLIELGHPHFAHADEAFDPTRVEVDEVTGTAADIGEVFDREPEAARAGGADHQPVGPLREKVGSVVFGKLGVVGLVIIPADPLFGHAGGAAGLKDIVGSASKCPRDEKGRIFLAQNLVIEGRELGKVREAGDVLDWIEAERGNLVEPVWTAGFWGKMPFHHVTGVGIKGGGGVGWHKDSGGVGFNRTRLGRAPSA